MFLAKRARVVSMNENDETYFASINPNILTVYCRIEDTPEIDDTRWICMNDALSQNRAAFNRSVILQRAENKEKMKQIVITNVLFLLNEWVLRNKTNV